MPKEQITEDIELRWGDKQDSPTIQVSDTGPVRLDMDAMKSLSRALRRAINFSGGFLDKDEPSLPTLSLDFVDEALKILHPFCSRPEQVSTKFVSRIYVDPFGVTVSFKDGVNGVVTEEVLRYPSGKYEERETRLCTKEDLCKDCKTVWMRNQGTIEGAFPVKKRGHRHVERRRCARFRAAEKFAQKFVPDLSGLESLEIVPATGGRTRALYKVTTFTTVVDQSVDTRATQTLVGKIDE